MVSKRGGDKEVSSARDDADAVYIDRIRPSEQGVLKWTATLTGSQLQ
jgi:hypothetical protein